MAPKPVASEAPCVKMTGLSKWRGLANSSSRRASSPAGNVLVDDRLAECLLSCWDLHLNRRLGCPAVVRVFRRGENDASRRVGAPEPLPVPSTWGGSRKVIFQVEASLETRHGGRAPARVSLTRTCLASARRPEGSSPGDVRYACVPLVALEGDDFVWLVAEDCCAVKAAVRVRDVDHEAAASA